MLESKIGYQHIELKRVHPARKAETILREEGLWELVTEAQKVSVNNFDACLKARFNEGNLKILLEDKRVVSIDKLGVVKVMQPSMIIYLAPPK